MTPHIFASGRVAHSSALAGQAMRRRKRVRDKDRGERRLWQVAVYRRRSFFFAHAGAAPAAAATSGRGSEGGALGRGGAETRGGAEGGAGARTTEALGAAARAGVCRRGGAGRAAEVLLRAGTLAPSPM